MYLMTIHRTREGKRRGLMVVKRSWNVAALILSASQAFLGVALAIRYSTYHSPMLLLASATAFVVSVITFVLAKRPKTDGREV